MEKLLKFLETQFSDDDGNDEGESFPSPVSKHKDEGIHEDLGKLRTVIHQATANLHQPQTTLYSLLSPLTKILTENISKTVAFQDIPFLLVGAEN